MIYVNKYFFFIFKATLINGVPSFIIIDKNNAEIYIVNV